MTVEERAEAVKLIYRHTHKDYKGVYGANERCIMIARQGQGTCLVTLDGLTDAEISDRLPNAVQLEEKRLLKLRERVK